MGSSKLLDVVICLSFFQLALIAFFNPTKVNCIANKWFSLFFFSLACLLLNTSFYQAIVEAKYYVVIALGELLRFVIAPALYLTVLYFTSPNKILKRKEYLHFAPFAIFCIYTTPFVIANGNHFFSYIDVFPAALKQWVPLLMSIFFVIQLLSYLVLSVTVLYNHQRSIKLINADVSGINLNWLQYTLYAILIVIVMSYAGILFSFGWIAIYGPSVYLTIVLYVGYSLIAQKEIYPFDSLELKDINDVISIADARIVTQRLTEDVLAHYKQSLITLMQTEKIYLDNTLNLPQLSKIMAISTHDLSYVLNKGFNMTFFQFVNSYRVEEAKTLMLSESARQFNILGIAYNSGFNSKSTFNTAFKKETGLSPSQFINNARSHTPKVIPTKA